MRLDHFLVEKNMVKSRSQATDFIKQGLVFHGDVALLKPGYELKGDEVITINAPLIYVSRAGLKLKDALDYFKISLKELTVLDIGASTGGFTDCALQEGATHVYCYDVGRDQLDPSLKAHEKVTWYEQTNILSVTPEKTDVILIDVSFTSIKPIITHIKHHEGIMIVLIKPQFEAGPISMKQGVLKDLKIHKKILEDMVLFFNQEGFHIEGIKKADLKGKQGNQEYLFYLKKKQGHFNTIKMIGEIL